MVAVGAAVTMGWLAGRVTAAGPSDIRVVNAVKAGDRSALQKLITPSLTERRSPRGKRRLNSFEIVWDLRDGVDAMPPRWSKRVF